jgi:putative PIN family toxin of toxin-antitoxin system
MRATLDTNVFVSALVFGGVLGQILDLHTDEAFILCSSPAIIHELRQVLAERFEWEEEDIDATLEAIFSRAEIVEPAITITASPDPDDNHILECAVASKSDIIVTGDDDLLRLNPFRGIPIMKPRAFLDIVVRMK